MTFFFTVSRRPSSISEATILKDAGFFFFNENSVIASSPPPISGFHPLHWPPVSRRGIEFIAAQHSSETLHNSARHSFETQHNSARHHLTQHNCAQHFFSETLHNCVRRPTNSFPGKTERKKRSVEFHQLIHAASFPSPTLVRNDANCDDDDLTTIKTSITTTTISHY